MLKKNKAPSSLIRLKNYGGHPPLKSYSKKNVMSKWKNLTTNDIRAVIKKGMRGE